jgi:hypothetical protein
MGGKRNAIAGFVKQRAGSAPISFVLRLGETWEDMELLEADAEKGEAVLRRGSEKAHFALDPAATLPRRALDPRQSSYVERLRTRRQELLRPRATPVVSSPAPTGEALKKHLEEYQMNLIRQGQPPLPVPLTPEMEDQLVAEGVLPPSK